MVANLPAAVAQDASQRLSRFEYTRPIMGTELKVILYAQDESHAAFAINAILDELEERSLPINNYKPNSEVSKLASLEPGKQQILSVELGELLQESKRWHELSHGAFDVTSGVTLELWNKTRKQKILPTNKETTTALDLSGWHHITLISDDDSRYTISFDKAGLKINVSGIATGYLIDRAMEVLRKQGITSALIDIGGDVIVSNPPPGSSGWKIDVAGLNKSDETQSRIVISNQAVTTSGDLNQFTEIDGIRYSHLIDPTTGTPIPMRISATVIAKRAIDADAAATAIAVLGIQKATPILDSLPIDSVLVLEQEPDREAGKPAPTRRLEWSKNPP